MYRESSFPSSPFTAQAMNADQEKMFLNMFRESANRRVMEDIDRFEYKLGLNWSVNKEEYEKPRYEQKLREQVHEYFRFGVKPPALLVRAACNAESLVPIVPTPAALEKQSTLPPKFGMSGAPFSFSQQKSKSLPHSPPRGGQGREKEYNIVGGAGTSSSRGLVDELKPSKESLKLPPTTTSSRYPMGRARSSGDRRGSPYQAFGALSPPKTLVTPSRYINRALVGGATSAAELHAKISQMRLDRSTGKSRGSEYMSPNALKKEFPEGAPGAPLVLPDVGGSSSSSPRPTDLAGALKKATGEGEAAEA